MCFRMLCLWLGFRVLGLGAGFRAQGSGFESRAISECIFKNSVPCTLVQACLSEFTEKGCPMLVIVDQW